MCVVLRSCAFCKMFFGFPRDGDYYWRRGAENYICNGCVDQIAEQRRFTREFEFENPRAAEVLKSDAAKKIADRK